MDLWLLACGWGVGAVCWGLVFWDSRRPKPVLDEGVHRPALLVLGVILTGGLIVLWQSREKTPRIPAVQPPVVVLKGGTTTEASARKDGAEQLEKATETHDEEHKAKVLAPGDDPPDDLVDRLRSRGVLPPTDSPGGFDDEGPHE